MPPEPGEEERLELGRRLGQAQRLRRAIAFFGYKPKTIQTDDGFEFSDRAAAKGKGFSAVGRDGPNILERFYRFLSFYSLADLAAQGARWNGRYNETPRMALKLRLPNQVEIEKLRKLMQDTGEVRCPKLLKRLTSIDN